MSEMVDTFYVRSRGKLAGPFAMDALQQLVKRGKVSRFDQLSANKSAWRSAGDFEELFAPPAPRRAAVAEPTYEAPVDGDGYGGGGGNAFIAPPANENGSFYYAQNGAAVGPVPLNVLQILATNGTLRGDDPVWAEGADIATPARQVPMLASFFSGRSRALQHGGTAAALGNSDLPRSVRSTQFYAKVMYLVTASIALIFSMMPIGIFDGRAVWWWQGDGWLIAGSVYTVIASVALLVVAPLVAGLTRPLVALSLIGAPLIVGLFATMLKAVDYNIRPIELLAIVTTWGLLVFPVLISVVTRLRPGWLDGGPTGVRVINVVLGGALTLASVGGIVMLCVAADNWTGRPTATSVTAYLCTWIGILADLAAGVLAIIAGKPLFSAAINRATLISIIGAGGVYSVAVIVALVAFDRTFSGAASGEVVYVLLRSLVLLTASMLWLSAAFQETLTWVFRDSAAE